MLLRIFNDETPLVNTTGKRDKANAEAASETPIEDETAEQNEEEYEAPPEVEDQSIEKEDLYLGEKEQERTNRRETWSRANGETDRFNTTV